MLKFTEFSIVDMHLGCGAQLGSRDDPQKAAPQHGRPGGGPGLDGLGGRRDSRTHFPASIVDAGDPGRRGADCYCRA